MTLLVDNPQDILAAVVDQQHDALKVTITNGTANNGVLVLQNANTEYEVVLPKGCVHFEFQVRDGNLIRWSFEPGKVATAIDPYITLKTNGSYEAYCSLNQDIKIYFACDSPGKIIEIIVWA